jgi:hypothetical protein
MTPNYPACRANCMQDNVSVCHWHVVPSPRSITQPERDEVEYDGRQHGGPAQDDSAFPFRLRPTTSATSPHPYDVAAAHASCEFYSDDGNNASNDADNPLPGYQLHGPPVWTSPPCCHAACTPSHSSCGNDDAVLQSIPAASKLLMVRGERSWIQ